MTHAIQILMREERRLHVQREEIDHDSTIPLAEKAELIVNITAELNEVIFAQRVLNDKLIELTA